MKIGVLLLLLAQFESAVEIRGKPKRSKRKRRLESEDSEEEVREPIAEEEEEEAEEVESTRGEANIYEAKMIEFEDEVEGQYYLQAISWEDRYWLDFHNLMQTVKGRNLIWLIGR